MKEERFSLQLRLISLCCVWPGMLMSWPVRLIPRIALQFERLYEKP